MHDLLSYEAKHNLANGEDNRDGSDNNNGNNWGAEGPSEDLAINETRARVQRAMLATLMFSHGTPMLLGGDEFGRSQAGNNNAYCQDNALSWVDWTLAESEAGQHLHDYVTRLIGLRRAHRSLSAEVFMHGREVAEGELIDIEWFDESGEAMNPEKWGYFEARLLSVRRAVKRDVTLLLINNTPEPRRFALPAPKLVWRQLIDSAEPSAAEQQPVTGDAVEVAARSVLLLAAETGVTTGALGNA